MSEACIIYTYVYIYIYVCLYGMANSLHLTGWKTWDVTNYLSVTQIRAFGTKHDDVIKWKHFPRYWPFVLGIPRSPVNSPHKGQWRGALMFSLICAWINGWVNTREAGDFIRHRAHYDVTVIFLIYSLFNGCNAKSVLCDMIMWHYNLSRENMVVSDALVPIWRQDILNHHVYVHIKSTPEYLWFPMTSFIS